MVDSKYTLVLDYAWDEMDDGQAEAQVRLVPSCDTPNVDLWEVINQEDFKFVGYWAHSQAETKVSRLRDIEPIDAIITIDPNNVARWGLH